MVSNIEISRRGRLGLITGFKKGERNMTDDKTPDITSKNGASLNNKNETVKNMLLE